MSRGLFCLPLEISGANSLMGRLFRARGERWYVGNGLLIATGEEIFCV